MLDDPWLLVFDNVSAYKDVERYIPVAQKGSVLLTTTRSKSAEAAFGEALHIRDLDVDDGARVLLKYLHETVDHSDPVNDHELVESAKEVSRLVGGLPLALAHIGGCLYESSEDLKEFLSQFSKELHEVWDEPTSALGPYERSLATVFDRALKDLDATTRRILDIMAFFNPDAIQEDLLFRQHQNAHLAFIGTRPRS